MAFSKDKWSVFKNSVAHLWPKSEGNFINTKDYYFESELDGDPVVKTFDNFTVGGRNNSNNK